MYTVDCEKIYSMDIAYELKISVVRTNLMSAQVLKAPSKIKFSLTWIYFKYTVELLHYYSFY